MVSEPWLLTRTSKCPLDLLTTSIALGKAGVAPCACEHRRHAQAVALRAQEIDDAVGEGHHDLPARQGLRGHHLLAGEDHAGAGRGVVQVEPHQVSAGRHGVAHTAVARRRWVAGPPHCPG